MPSVYMLDTNICSYIMRERPLAVLERLQRAVEAQDEITVSVITYYEMLLGTIGRKASPRHAHLVARPPDRRGAHALPPPRGLDQRHPL